VLLPPACLPLLGESRRDGEVARAADGAVLPAAYGVCVCVYVFVCVCVCLCIIKIQSTVCVCFCFCV
jgi:hypothetical protein